MNKNKYYSLQRLLSYNCYMNIVMSGRGTGKSFAGKKYIIDNKLKHNKESVYLRRTFAELDECKDLFFKDIEEFYPNHEFTVEGYTGFIDDEPCVYFCSLSASSNMKSTPYPHVTFILMDEYIVTHSTYSGRYLKNEMTLLLDCIETIFRDRETKGQKQRVLFLSNSVSYVCPLFSFFNIRPQPGVRFQRFKDNLILLEMFESEEFIREKKTTNFGRLISNTKYYDYAIGNQVLEDTNDFVCGEKTGKWKFMCEIKCENMRLGVWYNLKDYTLYIDDKLDKSNLEKFVIYAEDLSPGYFLVKDFRKTWRLKMIRDSFNTARILYKTQEIKKLFMDRIIKYI